MSKEIKSESLPMKTVPLFKNPQQEPDSISLKRIPDMSPTSDEIPMEKGKAPEPEISSLLRYSEP